MKYYGVAIPFNGMGMLSSETWLELMSRVLGDHIKEEVTTMLTNDLYCGGDTLEEALSN